MVGFSLHVGQPVPGSDCERLERLCRYAARPAVAPSACTKRPTAASPTTHVTAGRTARPHVVESMLKSLGLPSEAPLVHPARGSPSCLSCSERAEDGPRAMRADGAPGKGPSAGWGGGVMRARWAFGDARVSEGGGREGVWGRSAG